MLGHMSITLDTRVRKADTPRGVHPRLTDTAIERAKTQLGIDDMAGVAKALGYPNTMSLWRARVGLTPIRLSDARRIAERLNLSLDQVFEGGDNA